MQKKPEKSLKLFLRKLRYQPTNQPTNNQPTITSNTDLIGPPWCRSMFLVIKIRITYINKYKSIHINKYIQPTKEDKYIKRNKEGYFNLIRIKKVSQYKFTLFRYERDNKRVYYVIIAKGKVGSDEHLCKYVGAVVRSCSTK